MYFFDAMFFSGGEGGGFKHVDLCLLNDNIIWTKTLLKYSFIILYLNKMLSFVKWINIFYILL